MNPTNPIYQDADKAREHLEKVHWPNGPVCPHCGSVENITKLQGKSTRPGVYKCNACVKPFSVTVGTVMEDSKIPLNKWVLAFALVNSSKKGFSAHQLHRQLGITYKSAWFMHHRIREAMKLDAEPMGGLGHDIEADETYIGRAPNKAHSRTANSSHEHGSEPSGPLDGRGAQLPRNRQPQRRYRLAHPVHERAAQQPPDYRRSLFLPSSGPRVSRHTAT